MKFNPDEMRARFHEVMDEADAMMNSIKPQRDEYNDLRAKIDELKDKQKALAAQFMPVVNKAAELHNEGAMLCRALGGKTGPRTTKAS